MDRKTLKTIELDAIASAVQTFKTKGVPIKLSGIVYAVREKAGICNIARLQRTIKWLEKEANKIQKTLPPIENDIAKSGEDFQTLLEDRAEFNIPEGKRPTGKKSPVKAKFAPISGDEFRRRKNQAAAVERMKKNENAEGEEVLPL